MMGLPTKQERLMEFAINQGFIRVTEFTRFFSDERYARSIAARLVQLNLLRADMNGFTCLVDYPVKSHRHREVVSQRVLE